jgi:predicted nucleic acid-binding protein
MSNVLLDTTIWIEFFRGKNETINERVKTYIDEDKIFYNGIILGELLVGTNNEKEFNSIKNNFSGFKLLETNSTIFEKASYIGFKLRKTGITVPLTDLIIAAHAVSNNLSLMTADPHFKLIKKTENIKLEFLKQV